MSNILWKSWLIVIMCVNIKLLLIFNNNNNNYSVLDNPNNLFWTIMIITEICSTIGKSWNVERCETSDRLTYYVESRRKCRRSGSCASTVLPMSYCLFESCEIHNRSAALNRFLVDTFQSFREPLYENYSCMTSSYDP